MQPGWELYELVGSLAARKLVELKGGNRSRDGAIEAPQDRRDSVWPLQAPELAGFALAPG